MKDAGFTRVGSPYEMKYTDDWGNVHCQNDECPDILSKFFEASNMIDKHNQLRQADLALEKHLADPESIFLVAHNNDQDQCG